MLVAWLAKEHAVVIAVGRHDESSQGRLRNLA